MRNKLGIGFFGVMIVALMLVTGAYQLSYQRAKENMEVKLKVAKETQTEGRKPRGGDESSHPRSGYSCCGRAGFEGGLLLSDGGKWLCRGLLKRQEDAL